MHSGDNLSVLTKRERDVLTLIGYGLSSKEIAERLHRSIKTVNTHRSALGRKLGVSNRVQLARIAVHAGLVPSDPGSRDQEASHDHLPLQAERDSACLKILSLLDDQIGPLTGTGFFRKCVRKLVEVLQLKCAYIAELIDDGERMRSLAAWSEHGPIHTIEHDLSCLQWTMRTNKGVLFARSDARDVFPFIVPLVDSELDSYMATPLLDPRGTIIGLIAIGDDKPLDLLPGVELILTVLATRASTELQRTRDEQAYRDTASLLKAQHRAVPTPAYLWKIHGEDAVLEDYNDAAVASTDRQIGMLVGTTARELFEARPDVLEDFSRIIASRHTLSRRMPDILRTIGEPSDVILHYVFIAPAWIIVHTENITDDKRVERLIQRSEKEFQEQIEERTIQLRQEITSLRRLLDQAKRTEDLLRTGDSVFREVLEAASDGVLVCDRAGRIRIVNEQLANMFGYRRDELTDQPIEVLLPERFRLRHIKLRDAYMSQPRIRLMENYDQLPGYRKDGSEFEVEISLNPVRSDRDLCVLCTVRKATVLRPSDEVSTHDVALQRG